MIAQPAEDCWLHAGVVVRSSSIAGLGLFTNESIPAGTVVSRVGGRLVPAAELAELIAAAAAVQAYVDTIAVTETHHLVLPPRRPNGYGNHSCDPNLWWVSEYELAARRDISAGEEVTNDYATSTGDETFVMPCSCPAVHCRGTVTGRDWRLPELHHLYGDNWIPVLRTRIRRLTDPTSVDPYC